MEFDLLGLDDEAPKNNRVASQKDLTGEEAERERWRNQLVPNLQILNVHVRSRVQDILTVMLNATDKCMIQSFSRLGLLEETPLLRSHIWKLLLESMPLKHTHWKERRQSNYATYLKLLEGQMHIDHEDLLGIAESDNPFDQGLWDEIMLDTRRTHSTLNFFQTEVHEIKVYGTKPTRHCDILTRILYVWAKVNGSVRYVQGMNEILAPIYYLEFQQIKKESESQAFFMFSALITPFIDMHIKDMDKSEQGIMGRMMTLNKYLKAVDYELWSKLDSEAVHPQFYSFRWLALMLSQQFGLYDTMRIWDNLLSYDAQKRLRYLYCMCLAILKLRKKEIMENDFTNILPRLHKLKDLEVVQVMEIANRLYDKVSKVDIDKLLQRQEEKRREDAEKKLNEPSIMNIYKKTGDILNNLSNKLIGKKE